MKMKIILLLSLLLMSCHMPVFSHPGRLDANGGHYNHQTGEYHYHDGTHHQGGYSSGSSGKQYTIDELLRENEQDEKMRQRIEEDKRRAEEWRIERERKLAEEKAKQEEEKRKRDSFNETAHILYFVTFVAVCIIVGQWKSIKQTNIFSR